MKEILKKKQEMTALLWLALGLGVALCGWGLLPEEDSTQTTAGLSGKNTKEAAAREEFPQSADTTDSSARDGSAGFLARAETLKAAINAQGGDAKAYEGQIRQLLAEWSLSDPEAALSYSLSSDMEDPVGRAFFQATDAALTAWATRDLEMARTYVEQQAESTRFATELGPALMRVCMAVDPGKAREWVQNGFKSDSTELRPVLACELATILHEQGRTREIEQWLSSPEVVETSYACPTVECYAGLLAGTDARAALAFSKKLPRGSTVRGLALQEAMRGWAARDSGQVRDWITQKVPIDVARPDLFRDPEKVSPIPAGSYTSDELDYAMAGYVLAVAETASREVAMESLKSIRNPSLRQRLALQVAGLELKKSS
jgi:hypothetical protein